MLNMIGAVMKARPPRIGDYILATGTNRSPYRGLPVAWSVGLRRACAARSFDSTFAILSDYAGAIARWNSHFRGACSEHSDYVIDVHFYHDLSGAVATALWSNPKS